MITVSAENFNVKSQKDYDSMLCSLQFHRLKCKCGHSGCMTVHGYYSRTVRSSFGAFRMRVCRVICSECGRTHAILPASLVPYSQIDFEDQCVIIDAFENGTDRNAACTPEGAIDENDVKTVIRNYRRHWRTMLICEAILLSDRLNLIISCFAHYSMQFMQIRRTPNTLFENPT